MTRIAFFDLEETLVKGIAWKKVWDKFGAEKIKDEYLRLYDEGKIGFEEWRRELVKIWKANKVTKKQFEDVLKDYEFIEGAKELILGLKDKGFKIVVITGAVSLFIELVAKDLGIDDYFSAHEFIFDENGFFQDIKTAEFYKRGQGKIKIMEDFAKKYGCELKECIAVGGDDINDYWMMKEVESFAIHPQLSAIKEVVNHDIDRLVDVLEFV